MVSAPFDTAAFDRGIDPLMRSMTPDQARDILAYRADEKVSARIDELAKNSEGELTEAERSEFSAYARANNFIAVLQAKARKVLSNP